MTETNMAAEPVAVVCVGMAGSGKTTFMQRINNYLHINKSQTEYSIYSNKETNGK